MLQEYHYNELYLSHAVDTCPLDKNHTMHIHDRCEIFFFLSGDVSYLVEGSSYPLAPYDLMIMRPSEAHRAHIKKSTLYERYVINLPLSYLDALDPTGLLKEPFLNRMLGRQNHYVFSAAEGELICLLFKNMNEVAEDSQRQLCIRTHLPLLLNLIYRNYQHRDRPFQEPPSQGEIIVQYVNRHLFEELSVPRLANHFFLSASQFSRLFKQATGSAPWDYITQKRLTAAKEKIHSGIPAQQAGMDCGFHDYSTFYRAYKKHFDKAPSEVH